MTHRRPIIFAEELRRRHSCVAEEEGDEKRKKNNNKENKHGEEAAALCDFVYQQINISFCWVVAAAHSLTVSAGTLLEMQLSTVS